MSPSRFLCWLVVWLAALPAWGDAPDGGATTVVVPLESSLGLPPAPSGTPAEREHWLRARLDEILARHVLAAARVGVAVSEVDSGRSLYARNDATLLNPASNVKLVTTAAALARLGPEYRFRTLLMAEPGTVRAGAIEGSLYLKGHGDPSLVSEDLWKMVSDLASQGIRRVAGDVVVDDSFFDSERIGPGFEQKNEDLPFRAPAGAVSLNYNACTILVLPGKRQGAPARVIVESASPYFLVNNQAQTGSRTSLSVGTAEVPGHTEITVSGTIRRGDAGRREHRRVAHPDLYSGYSLRELLVRRGIKVMGQVRTGVVPPGGRVLVTHVSPSLGVLVRDVNKLSNNFMAEQVLKTLGAETVGKPATWAKGVDAVAKFLEGLGISRDRYYMTNGSGLYDANRFSAAQLVTLLRAAYRDFRFAADFVASLALAGADGTVGKRMGGKMTERYVRAKTGTLLGVSCLSGYAGAPGRMPLAFAFLMNGLDDSSAQEARRAQDEMADALVAFLAAN